MGIQLDLLSRNWRHRISRQQSVTRQEVKIDPQSIGINNQPGAALDWGLALGLLPVQPQLVLSPP